MAKRKATSPAWKYFEIDINDKSMANCFICSKPISYCDTTSNLLKVCAVWIIVAGI